LDKLGTPRTGSDQVLVLFRQLQISDNTTYAPYRSTVMNDPVMSESFTDAVAHLATQFHIDQVPKASTRNISIVKSTDKQPYKAVRLPADVWNKMSSDERTAHLGKARATKRAANPAPAQRGQKKELKRLRKVEALAKDAIVSYNAQGTSANPAPPPPPQNPAEQFGTKFSSLEAVVSKKKD
jgi:hypothetical protein